MIKLSSMTIVGRLAAGFGLMAALLVANAGIGAFGIQSLFANAHRAITNDVQLSQTASIIGQLILNERRFEKDVFINIGDAEVRASYKKKWDAAKSSLDERITSASKLDLADEDKKVLGQIGDGFRSYADGFERTYARIDSGQIKTTQEANGEFAAFKAAVHGMEDPGEALNGMAMARVNEASESLSATHVRSSIWQIAVALACLLIGTVMCILTIRSIIRPLGRAVDIARAVADGKLNNTIDAIGRDETGQLLSALKTMQDSLLENELNAKGQITAIGKAKAVAEFRLDEVESGAHEISSGNVNLSQRTEQQAASLEETATSMEEMTSTVKSTADNAAQAERLAVAVLVAQWDVVGVNGREMTPPAAQPAEQPPVERRSAKRPWKQAAKAPAKAPATAPAKAPATAPAKAPATAQALRAGRPIAAASDGGWKEF